MSKLILITGPNGAGKGTLLTGLLAEKGHGRVRTTMTRDYRSDEEPKERIRLRLRHFKREQRPHMGSWQPKFMELEQVRPDAWYGTRGTELAESMDYYPVSLMDIDLRGVEKWLTSNRINLDPFVAAAKRRKKTGDWIAKAVEAIRHPKVVLVTAHLNTLRQRMIDRAEQLGQAILDSDLNARMKKAQEDIERIPWLKELAKGRLKVIDNSHKPPAEVLEAARKFICEA